MNIEQVGAALSNETRLNLITIVRDSGPVSSARAHEAYVQQFNSRRRESIYKALEILVAAEILRKSYDQDRGEIVYELEIQALRIDFTDLSVDPERPPTG